MEQFTEAFPRAPRTLPRKPEAADFWGSPQDPRMAKIGAIETYTIAGT
jgi:hypothetical protein